MNDQLDWKTLIRRIRAGKFTPIISDRVFFPGNNDLLPRWADEIGYPYASAHTLTIAQMAQYLSATSRDDLTAKEDFLDFSKRYLLETMRATAASDQHPFLNRLEGDLPDLTLSELATRLDYPKYDDMLENPLVILASLPLPIYITTSYYDFLARALRQLGKKPRTEICYWQPDTLGDIPSVFAEDPDYLPSEQEPLIFHLNGVDTNPESLVLTEDDYLDFLVKVAQDDTAVPRRVAQALVDSSLALLGYRLDDWNFKTLFRGLINTRRDSRRRLSLSIQFEPQGQEIAKPQGVQNYLTKYFGRANFDIYWGTSPNFLQDLWQQWEGS